MQDNHFNKKHEYTCFDMQEIFDQLKNRSIFISQGFFKNPIRLWVTENISKSLAKTRKKKKSYLYQIIAI